MSLKCRCISDAVALNIGGDVWEPQQCANAYEAAQAIGTGDNGKLIYAFFSFDFTSIACTLSVVVDLVKQYANHPNQFTYQGGPMISSFEGDCLGISGWGQLKSQTNGYLMPFISGLESTFNQWGELDSWYWLV